jgi:hypothetical protein
MDGHTSGLNVTPLNGRHTTRPRMYGSAATTQPAVTGFANRLLLSMAVSDREQQTARSFRQRRRVTRGGCNRMLRRLNKTRWMSRKSTTPFEHIPLGSVRTRTGVAPRRCLCCPKGDEGGQQKVNNAAPEHPRTSELIWLNRLFRPACPSHHKSLASTFNPKAAGSIPARPITNSLQTVAVLEDAVGVRSA